MRRTCKAPNCKTRPSFNHEGSDVAMYCRKHAEDGMVDVRHTRCGHPRGCTRRPTFGQEGSKVATYFRKHAEDGMVDVRNKRCAHPGGCTRRPTFNHEGSKEATYCRQHAEDGMVDVRHKRCAHPGGCRKRPSCGYWADGAGAVCAEHEGDLTGDGLVITFDQTCHVAGVKGCNARARWGPDGVQPTHCDKHSQPKVTDGFVRVPHSSGTTPRKHRDGGVSGDREWTKRLRATKVELML